MILIKDKGFYRELFKLALPIGASSLVSFLVSISSNMLVAPLGNAEVAAVHLGNQVALLVTMLSAGIEGAVIVFSSHRLGGGEEREARRGAALGVIAALMLGVAFFVLSSVFSDFTLGLLTDKSPLIELGVPYLRMLGISFLFFAPSQALAAALRSAKKAKIPTIAAVSALAVSVLLNVVLIYGGLGVSALGILGAGIASLAARVVEFLILFIYTFFMDRELGLAFPDFLPKKRDIVRSFSKSALPLVASQLVWSVNTFFAAALMGHAAGDGLITGLSCATALYNLSYVATNGISGGVAVITGRELGASRDEDKARQIDKISRTVQPIFIISGLFCALFIFLLRGAFINLFALSGPAREWALGFMNILIILSLGTAYQSSVLNGIIKSAGEARFIFKLEAIFVFLIIIPTALLARELGATPFLIFAFLKCDQILKCPVAYLKLKALTKKSR